MQSKERFYICSSGLGWCVGTVGGAGHVAPHHHMKEDRMQLADDQLMSYEEETISNILRRVG